VFGEDASAVEIVNLAQRETEAGKRRTAEEGPMTFLQRLLMNQRANPKSITDHEILTHTWGNIAAGSDTTATAMRAVLYYVLRDHRIYQKLCAEVRQKLSQPIKFSDANSVTYLTACIQEAMRLHPSVGLILGRTVPQSGATICGYNLKAGTEVGMNAWILHRDPDVFPDPEMFYPERWLPDVTSEDHLKAMQRSFFAFGYGAHTCSGRHISFLETVKLIPTLLLHYDLELVDGGKQYKFNNLWFTEQEGLIVRLLKRQF
jgi:cytochrome P450